MIKLERMPLSFAVSALFEEYGEALTWERAHRLAVAAIGNYLDIARQPLVEGPASMDGVTITREQVAQLLGKRKPIAPDPAGSERIAQGGFDVPLISARQHALAKWLANCSLSGLHAYARDVKFPPECKEDEPEFRLRLVTAALNGDAPMHPNLEGLVHAD